MKSTRIMELVSCIAFDSLIDVGCDHGFISINAIEKGHCKRALASDVNKGPLETARENIKKHGLEDKITTILSNGLESVPNNWGETMIIAGMGGYLIKEILQKGNTSGICQMILQPQSDIKMVREYVYEMGFHIEYEKVILDRNKYYFILNCLRGNGKEYSKEDLILGGNIKKEYINNYLDYLAIEICKKNRILANSKERKNFYLLDIYKERFNGIKGNM